MNKEKVEMDFDSAIDPEEVSKQKNILPKGEAIFSVLKLMRSRRECGKLGTCNIADLELLVTPVDGDIEAITVEDSLPLHPDLLWKSLQFFTAIGHREHGDKAKFVPQWDKVEGASGRCVIDHRTFKKRDDAEGEKTGIVNQVSRYLAADEEYKPEAKKSEPTTGKKIRTF